MRKHTLLQLTLFYVILTIASCIPYGVDDEYSIDTSDLELVVPLLNSSLSISSISDRSSLESNIMIASDGSVSILYEGGTVRRTSAEIFPPIPGLLAVPLNNGMNEITLPLNSGDQIQKAIIGNTNIVLNFSTGLAEPVEVTISFPEITAGEVPFSRNFSVIGDFNSEPISLQGTTLQPSNNSIRADVTAMDSDGNQVTLENAFLTFDFFLIEYIEGIFSPRTFDIQGDVITVGLLDNWESGSILFNDPKLRLSVDNSFGLPTRSQTEKLNIVTTTGEIISLESSDLEEGISFEYPRLDQVGQVLTTDYTFDKSNSNIQELLSNKAARIEYDINALVNGENPENAGFITSDGFFEINTLLELPLAGGLDDLVISATNPYELSSELAIDSARVNWEFINEFPIEILAQAYILRDNVTIDSLFSFPLKINPARVNAMNEIVSPSESNISTYLDLSLIDAIQTGDQVLFRGKLSTPPSNQEIMLFENQSLSVTAGIKITTR